MTVHRPGSRAVERLVVALVLAPALACVLVTSACRSQGPREIGGVEVDIRGEDAVAESDLYASAFRELADFARDRLRAASASDAAFTMEHGLRERGYAHAHVSFELLPSEEAPTQLVFNVEEGPRAVFGEVEFPGRKAMDEGEIRNLLDARFGTALARDRAFRQSVVDEAVDQIAALYRMRGFHQSRVGPAVVTWNEAQTVAEVSIPIEEGRRFKVSQAVVEGDLPDEVRKSLRSLVGAPFRRRMAAEAAARIRSRLRELGYQDAKVRGRWKLDEGGPSASIFVAVETGMRQRIRQWELQGLERSDPEFMRELIHLKEGDLATQSALGDAVDALFGTGAFATVNVKRRPVEETPAPAPPREGEPRTASAAPAAPASESDVQIVDLDLVVEEKDARSFEAGGGWGSYEKLRGWVAYRDRNFQGIGRIFDTVVFASTKSVGVTSRVTDRYILGPDRTLSIGGLIQRREEPSFDSDTFEGDITARQRLGESHSVFFGYRMRIDTADDLDTGIRGEEEDRSRAAGLFSGVVHDTRDDRLFPAAGVLSEVGLFWSDDGLGADLDFLEWKVNWARYFDVGRGAVLAVGFRFTTRDVLEDRDSLPIQERLFLGGETTVRSFNESELGPTDLSNDPLGGLTSAMASIELRRNIWQDIDGALFYDVGTVSPDSWDISSPAGGAIGIGLRYRLPVGPVRLDFAYNPDHRFAASRNWALHLSFGFSF